MPETSRINRFIEVVEKRGLTWDKAIRVERKGLFKKISMPVIRVFITPERYYCFTIDEIDRSYVASIVGYPLLFEKIDEELRKIRTQEAYDALPDTGNRK